MRLLPLTLVQSLGVLMKAQGQDIGGASWDVALLTQVF